MSGASAVPGSERERVGPGRLVLVVGPSGAGKDTLLNLARAACAGDDHIVFPQRVVTREASAFEDNLEMSEAAFREALAAGAFALHWDAHGHRYGVPRKLRDDIAAGRTVVVNVSRTVIASARRDYANVVVVNITAPAEVLAERLGKRHRPSDADIGERLHRTVSSETVTADVTIINVGDPAPHGRRLIEVIKGSDGRALAPVTGGANDVDHHHD
ncbi:ribose 1,5-bisphosphate phosphokinase PhnN [Bradyrhizobium sp. SSBR45G]|uniref:phosphonate metabolism protein/1,5-bisphosphokinase (PRPP-forming) PhnN n=1 Tax=unclassified Bradyrhizobium TaxID=2631580 RepID=UPI0023429615|nr:MULTISPECIES: phosphonate metabolism protein/1,5-bisphosphokinase (PRPP-forming) PhnN [unclassified Bradyrhizobium]GLH77537.1 ribose 1,5-bisphosphate phosphokinase PhnN [Bradyrhizobium sp. SSBR45G]GLH84357.1 ribose 1,5-bisphosphate phosphokinase PhnN [Bradyrhizobium sp. SSBR45R]